MHPHPSLCLHLQKRIHQYPDSPTTAGRRIRPSCKNVAFPRTTLPLLYVFLSDFQIFFKKSISCYSSLVSVLCFGCIDMDDKDTLLSIWSFVYISFNHLFKPWSHPFNIVTLQISSLIKLSILSVTPLLQASSSPQHKLPHFTGLQVPLSLTIGHVFLSKHGLEFFVISASVLF